MSLAEHAERLQHRLDKLKEDEKSATDRAMNLGEFVGGVALSAGYRGYLAKNKKPMPKALGLDADTAIGAALVVAGFFEVLPTKYADHSMYVGAGLLAGAIGNKVEGFMNPGASVAGADQPRQLGPSLRNVSAAHGAKVAARIRANR